MTTRERMVAALNRLAKWRSFFASWQFGTRCLDDAEANAVRDHREATLFLRAEVTALLSVLLNKGLITLDEFNEALAHEATLLCRTYEQRFPGFKATDLGLDINVAAAADTMRVMNFKR